MNFFFKRQEKKPKTFHQFTIHVPLNFHSSYALEYEDINVNNCNDFLIAGYERQATHGVIGEVMRSRYAGNSGPPRPNEIIQVMLGDHNVNISYWKAWRSREVALDYAKGSSGESYKLLPDYLQRLVVANPGTITHMETQFEAGFGHRFKYMFLALAASVNGFKRMRSVIIIDGTHLRGKYGGCLMTASAQDGNYQVFPLAIGIVDSENDKAWEWFFKMLLHFIPNKEETVFVSDRHASIYYGISKVSNLFAYFNYTKGNHYTEETKYYIIKH